MATVDSLDIQISAQATKASASLDKLVGKLNTLSTSLSGISTNVRQMSNLAKSLSSLNKIDDSSIKNATKAIGKMAGAMNGIKHLDFGDNSAKMAELAKGISQLGYKSATQAIENIPKLAVAMKDLMSTLSTAPKVSQNLIDMTNAMAKFARTGSSGGRTANALSKSFTSLAPASNIASRSIRGMQNNFRNLFRSILPLAGGLQLINFGKQATEISSDLTEAQNVIDVTFGDYKNRIEDLARVSIPEFGMSELTAKTIAGRFQAMGTAMGFTQGRMADTSVELTKLTADMASFYNVSQEDVAKSLQSVFTGETEPLRKYGLDLTQATLQEWALKQGIDANIQSMSQAEKTMLRYQYVLANTGAAQGDFARTADTWANSVRTLKQNFQQLASVIGATLINALKPLVQALNATMGYIIAFAETVSNALGKIFGWKFQKGSGGAILEDMAGDSEDLADGLGGANDEAKKLKTALLRIDELNINAPDNTSITGGGAGTGIGGISGTDGAVAGQWIKDEEGFFESEIDSLYKLGKYIGDVLSDAMESINWNSVYEKASNFGTGLADFLNGLISPELFGNVGTTIASSLNTALYALNSFGKTFDWKDFGNSIASGINNFFTTFDFSLLANTVNTWAHGILDTIIETLDNTDWTLVGTQIGTFLADLDFIGVGKKIAETIWKTIGAAWDAIKGSFNVAPIETALVGLLTLPALVGFGSKIIALIVNPFVKVYDLITPIISSLGTVIGGLSAPVLAVVAAITALVAGLGYVFVTNEEVRQSFDNAINSIREGLQPALEFITGTLLPDLQSGWDRIIETLKPLGDFLEGTFTSVWQDVINPALTYVGQAVIPKVTEAFENFWNNVLVPFGSFVADVLEPIIKNISDALTFLWENAVLPLADAVGGLLREAFEGMCEIFNTTVIPALSLVISVFQFLWNDVLSPIISFFWDIWQPAIQTVFDSIIRIIDGIIKKFKGLIEFITGVFTGDWKKAWQGIKDIFSGIWQTLSTVLTTPLNAVIGLFEGLANKVIDAWNSIKSAINTLQFDVPDWVPGIGGEKFGFNFEMTEHLNIPRFAMGGFPEDGLFYANHNELVGEFTNGRTAVANNEMIVAGIEEAAYRGFVRANAENTAQEFLLRELIEAVKEGKTIEIDGRELVSIIDSRKARNGYPLLQS